MARRRGRKRSVTQQVKDVQKRYRKKMINIDSSTERLLTIIAIFIQNEAAFLTPQDTNALLNSQYRQLIANQMGARVMRIGYTQDYAAALHERTDWRPLRPNERTPPGGAYNPNATSGFLEKGAQAALPEIRRVLAQYYRRQG